MALPVELQDLARRVSNWGRWGPDDQRGTLNLIDEAAVQRGLAAARQGRPFSLAIAFDANGPQWDNVNMPERRNPELHTYAVNMSFSGDKNDFTTSDDAFRMGSQAATHWDALAHVGYEGKLWNDTPDTVVTKEHGAKQLGIEHFGPIATRGILLDIARLYGDVQFHTNYAITGDDLQKATEQAGVSVMPGDIICIRTGQILNFKVGDRQGYSYPSAGLSTKSIEWIRDHDVAAVATDNLTFEVYPDDDTNYFMPTHMIHLRDMGLAQGQVWDLEDLADDCVADGQYDFLLVASPLPLTHAVGAPVVPTAIK